MFLCDDLEDNLEDDNEIRYSYNNLLEATDIGLEQGKLVSLKLLINEIKVGVNTEEITSLPQVIDLVQESIECIEKNNEN